eukprot:scaffold17415_cov147-Isochrysis_galbana.AAC.3
MLALGERHAATAVIGDWLNLNLTPAHRSCEHAVMDSVKRSAHAREHVCCAVLRFSVTRSAYVSCPRIKAPAMPLQRGPFPQRSPAKLVHTQSWSKLRVRVKRTSVPCPPWPSLLLAHAETALGSKSGCASPKLRNSCVVRALLAPTANTVATSTLVKLFPAESVEAGGSRRRWRPIRPYQGT